MRYKSLTITITLTCLSIVAVAGLVMMPITGDCRLYQHGWNYYNNNTAANIMVTEDTKGASWQVFATVDAKAVSASIYTDDYNLGHFTEDDTFTGTGLVTAAKHNYTWYHDFYSGMIGIYLACKNKSGSTCLGHHVPKVIRTNRKDSPYFTGGDDALVLDIEANAKVEKHICKGYKKGDANEISITVPLKLDIPKIEEAGIEFTGKTGKTIYISLEESIKVYSSKPVVAQGGIEEGVSESVAFDWKANSSAHADFTFEGHNFPDGSVWYTAPE